MGRRKLSDEEKEANKLDRERAAEREVLAAERAEIEKDVNKYMKRVEGFIKDANGGKVPLQWEASLLMLRVYYEEFLVLNREITKLPADEWIVNTRWGKGVSELLTARDKCAVRLQSMFAEFGLTQKAATKLNMIDTTPDDNSPIGAFMNMD